MWGFGGVCVVHRLMLTRMLPSLPTFFFLYCIFCIFCSCDCN